MKKKIEDEKVIKIDMRDRLTTPHQQENNPFAYLPTQLSALHDPKNLELLQIYGGLKGLEKGLHTNIVRGLDPNQQIDTPVTLNEISLDPSKLNTAEHIEHASDALLEVSDLVDPVTVTGPYAKRIAVFGSNHLPPVKSKNIFQLMWLAFQDKTLILLGIAAVVSLAVGLYEDIAVPEHDSQGNRIPGVKWVEGVAIIVAILIVVLVGSVNDFQKEKQFRKLNAKKDDRIVKATREGRETQISVYDIQVGDVLHLEPGDIVAADGVFIEGHNVRCDESAATGESDAVRKQSFESCFLYEDEKKELPSPVEDKKNSQDFLAVPDLKDRPSSSVISTDGSSLNTAIAKPIKLNADPFILSGSKVLEGVCTYLVTATGVHSYHGRTMMALRTENESTPLQEKLNGLASMIAKLGSAAGLLMLVVLLIRYFVNWKLNGVPEGTEIVRQVMGILIVVITIVVVAVPEGLPLAVTLALAYATQRMLKDNNLVRVLAACETMGNATTVCSDKTGTLTQNKMTVVAGTVGREIGFETTQPELPSSLLQLISEGIAINSTAFENTSEDGKVEFVGNKTETALLQFIKQQGFDYQQLRTSYPVEQVFPFSSARKAMATVIRLPKGYRCFVKGASEILVDQCDHVEGEVFDDKGPVKAVIESYAKRCLRTIGLAYRDFDSWTGQEEMDEVLEGLNWLGVLGIEDPLRPGVAEAVKACQGAGVVVRMVTGDNRVTAQSIATQCGIYTDGIVMEGPEFRALPPSEMDAILPRLQVLARSSPEDKQILVGRLRELGEIVAVTGDGTNDGPALKLADVGFSMGIAGTEVAKEASSIILMDDNFSSIVKAIMWGRCVNDSVKKFLEFQITVNITAVILTFVSAVSSSSQKSVLTAVQLLWVNLIMDTLAALALATDPPTPELLERRPEPRSAPLITFKMWKMIIGQAMYQIVVTTVLLYSNILHYEPDDVVLQTIVFNTFVFCQIFNEINCRRIDSHLNVFTNILANKFFIGIFVMCVGLQAVIVNVGGTAFQVTKINGTNWAISILVGLMSLPIGVVVRLIPDEIFGFVFYFTPNARQRYLPQH